MQDRCLVNCLQRGRQMGGWAGEDDGGVGGVGGGGKIRREAER